MLWSGHGIDGGLAYNGNDGCLYGAEADNIWRIDPTNWSYEQSVLWSGHTIDGGLAYNNDYRY